MYQKVTRHILTSMSTRATTLVALVLCVSTAAGWFYASEDEKALMRAVKSLGESDSVLANIELLNKEPAEATGLLIAELHTLDETHIFSWEKEKHKEAMHVIWCIRALRYLTGGLDFEGRTAHEFGKSQTEQDRKYWLDRDEDGELAFFAVWPSREATYIAPEDAQEVIINKWREWYGKEGKNFDYKPLVNAKPWEWIY